MKSIHVLRRQHGGIDDFLADVFGQWSLDEDAVNLWINIELRQQCEQLSFGSFLCENVRLGRDAEFGASLLFASDINFGRWIFADAHEREARLDAARFECGDALREFGLYLGRDESTVNEVDRRHHSVTT